MTPETVVLLHGVGPQVGNMPRIANALGQAGYNVENISYPARKYDIAGIAGWIERQDRFQSLLAQPGKIHFTTYSLGGLIVRHYLETRKRTLPADKIGRVVMIGPPNHGSEWADLFHRQMVFKVAFGPVGRELTTKVQKLNHARPWYDLGIIAGISDSFSFIHNLVLPPGNDGKVSVESTKLDGMKDHIVLRMGHEFMGYNPETRRQVVSFLKTGLFAHDDSTDKH